MSKSEKSVKMVKVVALHDLSYIDHKGEPQYRRQSSIPFEIDEGNFKQFVERGAVAAAGGKVEAEAEAPVVDDFADETPKDDEPKGNTLSLKKDGKK